MNLVVLVGRLLPVRCVKGWGGPMHRPWRAIVTERSLTDLSTYLEISHE